MYTKFLNIFKTKKGFTLVEIFMCVTVLGILTAVAIPIFNVSLKKRREEDCNNQKQMISTTVKEVMTGMMDSGKAQDKIIIDETDETTEKHIKDSIIDGSYIQLGKIVTKKDEQGKEYKVVEGACTIADIRGRYRLNSGGEECTDGLDAGVKPTYDEGCTKGYYLKKFSLQKSKTPLYYYFSNREFPVCPCDENAMYLIDKDGNCYCSECDNIPVTVSTTAAAS